MSDGESPAGSSQDSLGVVIHESVYPKGHLFSDEVLKEWISIPEQEPVLIGPLTRGALDNLLFSATDISSAIATLRAALVSYTNGDLVNANKHLTSSMNHLVDGETRNRFLFDAIMRSVIEVRKNAGK